MSYRLAIALECLDQTRLMVSGVKEGERLGKITKYKQKRLNRVYKYWARASK